MAPQEIPADGQEARRVRMAQCSHRGVRPLGAVGTNEAKAETSQCISVIRLWSQLYIGNMIASFKRPSPPSVA